MLIPARLLLNGGSIAQEDTGNRGTFDRETPLALHPEFAADPANEGWTADACGPLAVDPATVEPIWRDLRKRSEAIGAKTAMVETTSDPLLRLEADGRSLPPVHVAGGRYTFVLCKPTSILRIVSRAARPSDTQPWLDDRRLLGICVCSIALPDGCGCRKSRWISWAGHAVGTTLRG